VVPLEGSCWAEEKRGGGKEKCCTNFVKLFLISAFPSNKQLLIILLAIKFKYGKLLQ
jgi:hypothetical protein